MKEMPKCALCLDEKVENPENGFIAARFTDGSRKFICGTHYIMLKGKK